MGLRLQIIKFLRLSALKCLTWCVILRLLTELRRDKVDAKTL